MVCQLPFWKTSMSCTWGLLILLLASDLGSASRLSLLLYIVFMNSLSKIYLSPGAKVVLYVDDILLYRPINGNSNLLKSDVNAILEWVSSHELVPNHSICWTSPDPDIPSLPISSPNIAALYGTPLLKQDIANLNNAKQAGWSVTHNWSCNNFYTGSHSRLAAETLT